MAPSGDHLPVHLWVYNVYLYIYMTTEYSIFLYCFLMALGFNPMVSLLAPFMAQNSISVTPPRSVPPNWRHDP